MKRYIVYDVLTGKIETTGICADKNFETNKKARETGDMKLIEGIANQKTQKIAGGEIVDKTQAEIITDNPPAVKPTVGQMRAFISNQMWENILARLDELEK